MFFSVFLYVLRREKIFGLYLLFLFLYAIMPQIGYAYFSELSEFVKAYFGDGVWYYATFHIIASILVIGLTFALFWRKIIKLIPLHMQIKGNKLKFLSDIAVGLLVCIAIFEISYFTINYQDLNWYTVQENDIRSGNVWLTIFLMIFKSLVSINIVLYSLVQGDIENGKRLITKVFFVVFLVLFIVIAAKLGNRTDILAFSLGILVFHLYRDGFTIKSGAKALIYLSLLGGGLAIIESTRYIDGGNELGTIASILMQDYYAPAHMLFAAINYDMIDPIHVMKSNLSNSLILLNYPYLQMGITDMINPGVATRSSGYAFYILTEGYLVAGPLGFIYNTLLVIFGWAVWRKLGMTNNQAFNNFLLALMGCMLVNLVRGQGSYFIKSLYTFILPGVLLYLMITSQSLIIRFKSGFPRFNI